MSIRHHKARGEWAELRFMLRATELGLPRHQALGRHSSTIWSSSTNGSFLRVQVKCTRFRRGCSYKCGTSTPTATAYTPDQIDFIAAYVIPTDTWYILPIEATRAQADILLTPQNPRSKHEKYREAWHLLQS